MICHRRCSSCIESTTNETFEEMLRNSSFVRLGKARGKSVSGEVIHVVAGDEDADLYVDIGWKFHAVVKQKKRRYGIFNLIC